MCIECAVVSSSSVVLETIAAKAHPSGGEGLGWGDEPGGCVDVARAVGHRHGSRGATHPAALQALHPTPNPSPSRGGEPVVERGATLRSLRWRSKPQASCAERVSC